MSDQWQPGYQPPQQYPPQQYDPRQYPPPPYGYPQPYGYQPRPDEYRIVTTQSGSTVFHVIMTFFTGGLWIFVWLACRRKVRVRVQYR